MPRDDWKITITPEKPVEGQETKALLHCGSDENFPYSFELGKIRTPEYEEVLKITILHKDFKGDKPVIYVGLDKIEDTFSNFIRYGVVIDRAGLAKIRQEIYAKLSEIPISSDKLDRYGISDGVLDDIINSICEHIIAKPVEKSKERYYYIPIQDFATLMKTGDYSDINISNLRRRLKEETVKGERGYIQANGGRTDLVVNINGKAERVVAFYAKKLDKRIEELKERLANE